MRRMLKCITFMAVCCLAIPAGTVSFGQEVSKQSHGSVSAQCQQANATSETRYEKFAKAWRVKLTDLRSKAGLQRMASDAASIDEKLAQGFDLFSFPGGRTDRMRASFRKHVVDERALASSMADSFAEFQKELDEETSALFAKAGLCRETGRKLINPVQIDCAKWERAFDSTINKAKSLSQEDWFRFVMVTFGSDLIADGIVEIGKQSGIWRPQEGSWEALIGGFAAQLAVEAVVEQVTDPTLMFASKLQASMSDAEKQMLNGPTGLLSELRRITTLHQQIRLQHLATLTKGSK